MVGRGQRAVAGGASTATNTSQYSAAVPLEALVELQDLRGGMEEGRRGGGGKGGRRGGG